MKFHENPSSGSRFVPCGQMDRHDVANSRFSNFTNAHKENSVQEMCENLMLQRDKNIKRNIIW